jgi:hypothetical protein
VLHRATLVLVAAAVLAPVAGAGGYAPCTPRHPLPRVVVRTELVPGSSDGFDWLDAAAGFGLAMASVAVVLLAVAGHRSRVRSAKK